MFEPVKVALGEYMQEFHAQVAPTTKPLVEFTGRDFAKCVALASCRQADQPAEIMAAWQKNDTDQAPTRPYKLPVILVAITLDSAPTGREYARQIADPISFVIPDDAKGRLFRVRVAMEDLTVKILFVAAEEPTARSLAKQFQLFMERMGGRNLWAIYRFAGVDMEWPVQIDTPENPVMSAGDGEVKNLTLLAMDVTLKCSIPLFYAPKAGEPNDGQGTPGDAEDPAGYPPFGLSRT